MDRRVSRGLSGQMKLDCTTIDNKNYYVVGAQSQWLLLKDDMSELASGNSNNWYDIAVGNLDNAGSLDVQGCASEGCAIDMVDLDGDGIDEIIVNENNAITIYGWDTEEVLMHQGPHQILDIDKDGLSSIQWHHFVSVWFGSPRRFDYFAPICRCGPRW